MIKLPKLVIKENCRKNKRFKYYIVILSITMQTISLKLEDSLLKEIDNKLARHRYSTRTEFVREALREKLSELEKDELLREIAKLHGSSKRKTTDEKLQMASEKAFELLEKKFRAK